LFVFYSTGKFALIGLCLTLVGVAVFFATKNLWKRNTPVAVE
jgi:hypothetical protein